MATEQKTLIELGDPEYDAIYAIYLHQHGKTFNYAGLIWRAVKDGALVKFARIGSGDANALYGSNSMPSAKQ